MMYIYCKALAGVAYIIQTSFTRVYLLLYTFSNNAFLSIMYVISVCLITKLKFTNLDFILV